jgi:hypothetical protein
MGKPAKGFALDIPAGYGSQESEVRSQESGVRSQESEWCQTISPANENKTLVAARTTPKHDWPQIDTDEH